MIRVVTPARRRSISRYVRVSRGPKNPSKTCPWNTCTRTFTPAATAATLPNAPAFAVCVSTTSGRQRRKRYVSLARATASSRGRISRPSSGMTTGCTPCARTAGSMLASPFPSTPVTTSCANR